MSKAEKLYEKMRRHPLDWRIRDVETVAHHFGLSATRPGGSHVTYRAPSGKKVTIPDHKPIKPVYIKKFVELIRELDSYD